MFINQDTFVTCLNTSVAILCKRVNQKLSCIGSYVKKYYYYFVEKSFFKLKITHNNLFVHIINNQIPKHLISPYECSNDYLFGIEAVQQTKKTYSETLNIEKGN